MKKVTTLVLLLIFTLSLALPVSAASGTPGGPGGGPSMSQGTGQQGGGPGKIQAGRGPGMGGNGFSGQLSSLVTDGTLTQDQIDAVVEALKPSDSEKPGTDSSSGNNPASLMKSKLDALVTAGTISSDEEETILDAIKPPSDSQGGRGGNPMDSALSSLVTDGTITQEVADTILEALKPSGDGSTTTKTDMKTALETELAALVTAGTITQDQADAISKAAATAAQKNGHLKLRIGSAKMTVGSGEEQIDPGYNTAPVIEDGSAFVPIRAIIESLGGTVTWDSDAQTLTITLDDNTVTMTVGSNTATVNGKTVTLSNDPYISGTGRTMVPIRFLAESLGMTVNWDQSTRSIDIEE
ncbi:MAG: copper amine oxidase N-terminal domain-containing protein [Deltaproteobacteria bacterium]